MGILSAKRLVFVVLLAGLAGAAWYYRDVFEGGAKTSDGTVAKKGAAGNAQQDGGGRGRRAGGGTEVVAMATVEQRNMPVRVEGIGNVEAYTFVQIKPRVDGQIVAVNFKEGQEVKQGEVLFRIDPRPYEAALKLAEAALARDRAVAERANAQEQRQKELLEKKFVSTDGYAQFRANADSANAAVRASEAQVENARVQVDYTTIRSPITGYVGKIFLQLGNIARFADVNPITVINQVHPIYVTFSVPESRLAEIRNNMKRAPLQVEAVPADSKGKASLGKLVFIDNAVDQSTGTIKLRAEFPNNDNALWPGLFANVKVKLFDDPAAIVVPSVAIQTGPNGQFVFVVKDDSTVDMRPVKVARAEGDLSVIAEGLKKDEVVVTQGQLRLAVGTKVVDAAKVAERGPGKGGDGAAKGGEAPAKDGEKGVEKGATKAAEKAADKKAS